MIIVLDIGGTQIRVAGVTDNGELSDVQSVVTPKMYADGLAVIQELIPQVHAAYTLESISVGIAGVIPHGHTVIARSPHLPDWESHDLGADLTAAFNVPTYVHNDVTVGGLGEARYGAGKGATIVAYVAVGTGVGGVRIVDGKIDRTSVGFEIGHQLLSSHTSPHIEWESLVSGSALFARYGKTGRELMYDPLYHDIARDFSIGLYNTILHWSPDVVVLGGSICSPGGIEAEEVTRVLSEINTILPSLPTITYASLAGTSGLMGAYAYAHDALRHA